MASSTISPALSATEYMSREETAQNSSTVKQPAPHQRTLMKRSEMGRAFLSSRVLTFDGNSTCDDSVEKTVARMPNWPS